MRMRAVCSVVGRGTVCRRKGEFRSTKSRLLSAACYQPHSEMSKRKKDSSESDSDDDQEVSTYA